MKKENTKKLIIAGIFAFILIYLVSAVYTIFAPFNLQLDFQAILYKIGKFIGLTSFLFISFLVISGDSARFFDKYFGIDRIIKFQRKFAIASYFVVLSHPIFFILSSISFVENLIPNFAILPLAAGTLGLYSFIIIMISSLNYKRISHKVWQYLHVLTYVLFFLILYHASFWGTSSHFLIIKIFYTFLAIFVIAGIIYRTNYKIRQKRNKFLVKEIKWEAKDTFTLILNPKHEISFEAGQFCFLRLEKEGLYARHPFTISNAPGEKELHFTIKLDGRFTKEATKLKPRDEIKLEGPFGNFTINDNKKDIVFIAGGVGITPFRSMIRDKINRKDNQKTILLYSSKKIKDIIFKKELDKINKNWFKKVYILTREKRRVSSMEKGRISKEMITEYVEDPCDKDYYICGPIEMKNTLCIILNELGVKGKNIFFEDFFW